jgi:hypothetical protein
MGSGRGEGTCLALRQERPRRHWLAIADAELGLPVPVGYFEPVGFQNRVTASYLQRHG